MFNTMAGPTEMIFIESLTLWASPQRFILILSSISNVCLIVCVWTSTRWCSAEEEDLQRRNNVSINFLCCYRDFARLWSCKSKALRIRIVFHENYVIKFVFIWSVLVVVWSGWWGWHGWLGCINGSIWMEEWWTVVQRIHDEVCLITNLSWFRWIIVGEWVAVMW